MGFDENLKQLDKMLARLEEGKLPLEEALSAFEQGVALVRESREFLDKAEQRVTLLTKDGEEAPFVHPRTAQSSEVRIRPKRER